MSIVLVRVDDRLIHGQVVVAWVQTLGVQRIVVVGDEVSANSWEQELYSLGVPPAVAVEFASVEQAVQALSQWVSAPDRTILLVADVGTIMRLCKRTNAITTVNLGGIHDGSQRTERLAYLYLSSDEARQLGELSASGVEITAQDVPTGKTVPLAKLL